MEVGTSGRRFHLQNRQYADEIDNLSVESYSQANQRNQAKLLPGTTTLKRKAASSEQTFWTHFGPHPASPGLHVKTSISLPRVGEVPHLTGVPRFPRFSATLFK